MSENHKLLQINGLSDDQAKALVSLMADAATNKAPAITPKDGSFDNWTAAIITLLTGLCVAGIVWLLTLVFDLSQRVTLLEAGQKVGKAVETPVNP